MIRVDRGDEPPELAKARGTKLAAAVGARAARGAIAFDGYGDVRDHLYKVQRQKCAYCERLTGLEGQPIEHFRPKAESWRGDPWKNRKTPIDRNRYWWLAWSHHNLWFVCATCNCQARKGNWFPLETRTKPLAIPRARLLTDLHAAFQIDRERPLLVDPAIDDPLDHIAWVPLDPMEPVDKMEWRPIHKTERGRYTIKILGLDRGVSDQVGLHIRRVVYPRIEGVTALAPSAAIVSWNRSIRDLLADTMPFLAATHDALDFFVPTAERKRLRLVLTRPGAPVRKK